MKVTEYLNDSEGQKSSKRLFGSIFAGIGGGLLIAVGITAIFITIADPDTAMNCGKTLLFTGGALLGWGVFDGIGKTINSKIVSNKNQEMGG